MLRFISNILWILFCGLWLAILWCFFGILLCVTLVGIPFGLQCFRIAGFSLMPRGKKVKLNFAAHPIANVIWVIVGGWEMALAHLVFGLAFCVTVIGIPKGVQCFKITKLALFPFGAYILQ